MKYVALLRGINVGGNTMIKMVELKKAFEDSGFNNVITYINSGNVVFESDKKTTSEINKILEKELSDMFHFSLRVVTRSYDELKKILDDVPSEWKKKNELRCYIAFVREPITPVDIEKEISLKEGIDSLKLGKHVLYMSTKLSGLTKSSFTKLASKKIYKEITIRNLNTAQKLLTLMEKN